MSQTIKAGLLARPTFGSLPIPSGTVTIGLPMSIGVYSCGYSSGIESVSLTGFPIRTSPCETGRSPLPKTKVTFFRIKPKAIARFCRPCVRQPFFFLLFPVRKRKPQPVRPLPHSVAGGAERGRRHIPASYHPVMPIFSGSPVCSRLQERYERRGAAGRPNSPKIMPIRREHKKPYITGPSSRISMSSWVGLVFRRTDSRQIHLFRQSSTAPPHIVVSLWPVRSRRLFSTRRPFTMNAPPPCLHRKKPSRKRIACFPSTVSFPPERAPSCRRGAPSLRRNVPEQNRRPSVFPCRTLCRLKEPSETAIGGLRTSSPRTVGTPTPNRRAERPGTIRTPENASRRVSADHPASPRRPSPGFYAALTASESVPHRKHRPAYDRKTEPCRSPPVLSSSPEHRQPVAPVIRFALSRRLPATYRNGSESEPHRTSGNSSSGRQPPLSSRRGPRRKNREGRPNPSDTLPYLSIVENRGPARPAAGFSVTCRKRTAKYGRIPRSEYRAAEYRRCKPPD